MRDPRNRTPRAAIAVSGLVAVLLTGCGTFTGTISDTPGKAGDGAKALSGLQVMVPNTAGGGYDTTARTAVKVMQDTKIAKNVTVFNLPGAGGTVGLARLVSEKGNGNMAMLMGLGVVGAVYTNKSPNRLSTTTPLARLIEESGAIIVPKSSPYRTLNDLVTAWKANPRKVSVGGGSSPGGPDHLLPMQLAKAVGISPKKVNYVAYDGGGELLPALLSGKVAFGASGFGEFLDQVEAGQLRVLAVTSAARVPALQDVPTLTEQGVNLTFTNWRGLVAPPGITTADRDRLIAALDRLRSSLEWRQELQSNGWTDAYLTGQYFAEFLTEQDEAVSDVLTDLGLTS